jgi:hypothetical protein
MKMAEQRASGADRLAETILLDLSYGTYRA